MAILLIIIFYSNTVSVTSMDLPDLESCHKAKLEFQESLGKKWNKQPSLTCISVDN